MKRPKFFFAITVLMVLALSGFALMVTSPVSANGATQISGIGEFAKEGECTDPEGVGADFVNKLEGDLVGCLYIFVDPDSIAEPPSGTYRDAGSEIFVGTYMGQAGTFKTTYLFTAKFDPETGDQQFGRCQHPIEAGSGTGVFMGVTGRLDFKDDIEAGNFPFRGHLRW